MDALVPLLLILLILLWVLLSEHREHTQGDGWRQ